MSLLHLLKSSLRQSLRQPPSQRLLRLRRQLHNRLRHHHRHLLHLLNRSRWRFRLEQLSRSV